MPQSNPLTCLGINRDFKKLTPPKILMQVQSLQPPKGNSLCKKHVMRHTVH